MLDIHLFKYVLEGPKTSTLNPNFYTFVYEADIGYLDISMNKAKIVAFLKFILWGRQVVKLATYV